MSKCQNTTTTHPDNHTAWVRRITACVLIGSLWSLCSWQQAEAAPIELKGTLSEVLGKAAGRSYEITNKTGEPLFGLNVAIQKKGGGDPGATIKSIPAGNKTITWVTVSGLKTLDAKIKPKTNDDVVEKDNKESFNVVVNLTNETNGEWRIVLQPLDYYNHAIGDSLGQGTFKGTGQYAVTLIPEEVEAGAFSGLAFNDINDTGQTLTELSLAGQGFQVTDAFQKDADGKTLTGSVFKDGILYLAQPISLGGFFFVDAVVDHWISDGPMTISASVVPEPSTLVLLSIGLVGLVLYIKYRRPQAEAKS